MIPWCITRATEWTGWSNCTIMPTGSTSGGTTSSRATTSIGRISFQLTLGGGGNSNCTPGCCGSPRRLPRRKGAARSRLIARFPTTLSKRESGATGEKNRLRVLGREWGWELEERHAHRHVLAHGIDAIYHRLKTTRFNFVESKATSETGRIGLGILRVRKHGGRQLSDTWIRWKLDEAAARAERRLSDPDVQQAARLSAHRTQTLIPDLFTVQPKHYQRTLVVTRHQNVEPDLLAAYATVTQELLREVGTIYEVSRSGRVLLVYSKGCCRP